MSEINFTEAFAKCGAKLTNPQWAFSAIANDGSLVLSCWQHKLSIPEKGILRYSDCLSRWQRVNAPGRNLFLTHLTKAFDEKLPVRLVIVSTKNPEIIDSGGDASRLRKTFDVKEHFVGQVTAFDGDVYIIDFKKRQPDINQA